VHDREHFLAMAVKVLYEGRVQGVGFRWAVRQIAKGFDVIGWVTNLPDGRVELQVEGEENEMRDFLKAIDESDLRAHIKARKESPIAGSIQARGFEIRHE